VIYYCKKNSLSLLAVVFGGLNVVRALVEEGHADLTLKDESGETALDKAKSENKTDVVEYLTTINR
jgi:ankyrin repeat protein